MVAVLITVKPYLLQLAAGGIQGGERGLQGGRETFALGCSASSAAVTERLRSASVMLVAKAVANSGPVAPSPIFSVAMLSATREAQVRESHAGIFGSHLGLRSEIDACARGPGCTEAEAEGHVFGTVEQGIDDRGNAEAEHRHIEQQLLAHQVVTLVGITVAERLQLRLAAGFSMVVEASKS